MRFFLIDRVTELVPGEHARGVKCVTLTDEVLHDHFPDYPVMPGVLVVEAAAQLAGFLLEQTFNREGEAPRRAVLMQIDKAKFHTPAMAGDQIDVRVQLEATMQDAAKVAATAHVGERSVATAKLTFMLRAIDSERVHEQRRYLYRLWTRDLKPAPKIL